MKRSFGMSATHRINISHPPTDLRTAIPEHIHQMQFFQIPVLN